MWLSQFIPGRITPCVLTCLGLAINLGSCLILLYFSPDAKAEVSYFNYIYVKCYALKDFKN